jgi:hypothetical protein
VVDGRGELDEAVEKLLVVAPRLQAQPVVPQASWAAWYRPAL